MTKEKIVEIINEVVSGSIRAEQADLRLDSIPDWDSLAFLRVVSELEEQGVEFDIEKLDSIYTLGDLFVTVGG